METPFTLSLNKKKQDNKIIKIYERHMRYIYTKENTSKLHTNHH